MSKLNCLYIIATPIGNLGDVSYRALECLQQADVIAAEDTRHSRRLLDHYQISTPMLSLHAHNEAQRSAEIVARLESGETVALVSDAGTPLISDPGYRLVRAVREAGFRVSPLPGACALIAALSAGGLPTDRFLFVGFLPTKKQARLNLLADYLNSTATVVLYEAPHRILQLMQALIDLQQGKREIAIAREISKTFETFFLGTAEAAKQWIEADSNQQRGEFVVMIKGADEFVPEQAEQEKILKLLMAEMPLKKAVKIAQSIIGGDRNALYEMGLRLK